MRPREPNMETIKKRAGRKLGDGTRRHKVRPTPKTKKSRQGNRRAGAISTGRGGKNRTNRNRYERLDKEDAPFGAGKKGEGRGGEHSPAESRKKEEFSLSRCGQPERVAAQTPRG